MLVTFHWLVPAQPSCELWDQVFLRWEWNLKKAERGFTFLCIQRRDSSPGRKDLVFARPSQGCSRKSLHMTCPLSLFECKWQKGRLVSYYHFSACGTLIESLFTVLMPFLWPNWFRWLIQFVLCQLPLNALDLLANHDASSPPTAFFLSLWTQQHGSTTE